MALLFRNHVHEALVRSFNGGKREMVPISDTFNFSVERTDNKDSTFNLKISFDGLGSTLAVANVTRATAQDFEFAEHALINTLHRAYHRLFLKDKYQYVSEFWSRAMAAFETTFVDAILLAEVAPIVNTQRHPEPAMTMRLHTGIA